MIDVFLGAIAFVVAAVYAIATVVIVLYIDDWRLSRREFQREDAERVRQKIEAANKFRLGRKE